MKTPKELGFSFPAEFAPQRAMWLSWPHKEASWPGKIETIFPVYARFIKLVAENQRVCINVTNEKMKSFALSFLEKADADLSQIDFSFTPPTMPGAAITALPFWFPNNQQTHHKK